MIAETPASPSAMWVRAARATAIFALAALPLVGPANAEVSMSSRPQPLSANAVNPQAAGTATTSAGQVGQRQSRTDASREIGTQPMARINNRIPNRVQARVRTRIQRNYNPQLHVTSPFAVAEESVEAAGRPR